MKKIRYIILPLLFASSVVNAQCFSEEMLRAVNACEAIAAAAKDGSVTTMRQALKTLKASGIDNYGELRLVEGSDISVDGHFIFDEDFIDSLMVNGEVKRFAARYIEKRNHRNIRHSRIKLTTRALKAGSSATWKARNKEDAEYAIIAEPNGLFTMTIRDKTGKILYTETKKNKKGAPVRKARLKLPSEKSTTLLIEIKNCGANDASFAIISN